MFSFQIFFFWFLVEHHFFSILPLIFYHWPPRLYIYYVSPLLSADWSFLSYLVINILSIESSYFLQQKKIFEKLWLFDLKQFFFFMQSFLLLSYNTGSNKGLCPRRSRSDLFCMLGLVQSWLRLPWLLWDVTAVLQTRTGCRFHMEVKEWALLCNGPQTPRNNSNCCNSPFC